MSGSSIGGIALGIVGAAIGGYFGGFQGAYAGFSLGMTVGGAVGSALDPPKNNNGGPRLSDLTIQTATYGAFIPRLYGTIAVFGNIFWLENNQLKETANDSGGGLLGGKGMGGGGAASTTYTYSATFALGLCDCSDGDPIIGIKRIWIGPKLFYHAGSSNHATIIASNKAQLGFKLYRGTDTQTANARMQSTLGVANVPAYRGLAYIVFYDLPLADYGNSLIAAQIKVEIVKAGSLGYVFEKVASETIAADGLQGFWLVMGSNNNYAYCLQTASQRIITFDINNPERPILTSTTASEYPDNYDSGCFDGTWLYVGTNQINRCLKIFDVSSPGYPVKVNEMSGLGNWISAMTAFGDHVYAADTYANTLIIVNVFDKSNPYAESTTSIGGGLRALIYSDGILYALDRTNLKLLIIDVGEASSPVILSSLTLAYNGFWMVKNGDYLYIRPETDNYLIIVDISNILSPAVANTIAHAEAGPLAIAGNYLYIGSYATVDALDIYNLDDPENPAYVASLANEYGFHGMAASGNYLYTSGGPFNVYFFGEPIISSSLVPLSDIVSAECIQSKLLTTGDIDVTTLTPEVRGYRISDLGTIRAGIEPLQAAWPFDVVQHGYKVKFVLRGTASVAAITAGELDARESGKTPGVQIINSREMDSILPRKVSIKHFDSNREYDTGEQYAERINTDAVNAVALNLAVVLTSQEAAQKAEVLLYLYWMERYDISFSLPPDYSELEPADVITITTDDAVYELRLTSVQYTADGRLECKAKYNFAALYVPVATGEDGQSTGTELTLSGDTLYELLDIPMLQDVYDMPGFPVAMTGYAAGWPGGVLFRSEDTGQTWAAIQGFSSPGSTMAWAVDALAVHGGTVLDKSGVLTVRMRQGTLSSVTEAQLFAGQNWFAYGADGRWEIIAAENCDLQGDGSYILTDFLRGQNGTEWATGLHVAGDRLIHLSSSELFWIKENSSAIGVEKLYRGITRGETIDTDSDYAFSYDGVNFECLSPCQLTGNIHPTTKDWTLTWTRRTRFAGWRALVDAALGEASESYVIEIYSDGTYVTVVRTLTATSPTVAYTRTQQETDFGIIQPTLYVKIYQLSATVGRGYPLIESINRGQDLSSYEALALFFEGSNGSTTFVDSSANTIKSVAANGNAQISTAQYYTGASSGLFDGAGDYLSVTDHNDFNFGSGDFTIQMMIRPIANPGAGSYACLYAQRTGGASNFALGFWLDGTNKYYVAWTTDGVTPIATTFASGSLPTVGAWNKIELIRRGANLEVWLDDVQQGSTYNIGSTNIFNSSANVVIGCSDAGTTWPYNGYIDTALVYKGYSSH